VALIGSAWFGLSLGSVRKLADLLAPYAMVLLAIFEILFLPGMVWFFAVKRHSATRRELGLVRLQPFKTVGLVVVSMISILIFGGFYSYVLDRLWKVSIPEVDLVQAFGGGMIGLALAVLLGGIITPFAEELFFRGFIYPAFRKKIGVFWAIIVSAFIFGFSHLSLWLVLPMAFIGAAAAWLYEGTGSLYAPIALHVFNNLLAVLSFYLKF
jgi:membrane protease YdiL (CAAX protease family)